MRITSSKCVLQQRHLLGYQSRTPTLNPNPNHIFNPNPNNVFERKQKRHRNIGQHRVIFTGYTKGRRWVYQRHITPNWKFFLFGTHVPYLFLAVLNMTWSYCWSEGSRRVLHTRHSRRQPRCSIHWMSFHCTRQAGSRSDTDLRPHSNRPRLELLTD